MRKSYKNDDFHYCTAHLWFCIIDNNISKVKIKFLLVKSVHRSVIGHTGYKMVTMSKNIAKRVNIATRNDGIALTREAMGTELNLKPLSSLVLKRLGEYHKL